LSAHPKIRFLLLQIRDGHDPMLGQEVDCFSLALQCQREQIDTFNLTQQAPSLAQLKKYDAFVVGGSGDYSVVTGGPWLEAAFETMRELAELARPCFSSCWGFQAMSKALGGRVVTDLNRAELGTPKMRLTSEGKLDPIFGQLHDEFPAPMGHQDIVDSLPEEAILLASSDRVENQAFQLRGKPVYGTQFHPELTCQALRQRVVAYPEYAEKIGGTTVQEFCEQLVETSQVSSLLSKFVDHCFPS